MSDWRDRLPLARGRISRDADDLAAFLKGLDPAVPVTVIGVGSNLLVRDGGVEGAVISSMRAAMAPGSSGRPWNRAPVKISSPAAAASERR